MPLATLSNAPARPPREMTDSFKLVVSVSHAS
jgi:hypothetical protein